MSDSDFSIDKPGMYQIGGATLLANFETEDKAQGIGEFPGKLVFFSRKLPGKTSDNEDSLSVTEIEKGGCVLSVADGMGGMPCGDQASRLAISQLGISLSELEPQEGIVRDAILNGIDAAHQQITGLGVGAGSTLAVVEISNGTLRPYHVGDSVILVTGQRGKIKFQSIPHSPVGYAMESGMMNEKEAMHHDERHIVSNFLGDAEMRIDIGPTVDLAQRDTVLVASDGLSDNLLTGEIVEIIRKGDLESSANELADLACKRMLNSTAGHPSKPDDLSFILYRKT